MAVRFGNVLDSRGSVVPLFREQIGRGGPLTITHPEVHRYFMTIPEACSLVLQTGAIGKGNEIFVLKMGTPTRIDAMARDLITLSGFTPDVDIKIEYSGLRPGEKMHEDLTSDGEQTEPSEHPSIQRSVSPVPEGLDVEAAHRELPPPLELGCHAEVLQRPFGIFRPRPFTGCDHCLFISSIGKQAHQSVGLLLVVYLVNLSLFLAFLNWLMMTMKKWLRLISM